MKQEPQKKELIPEAYRRHIEPHLSGETEAFIQSMSSPLPRTLRVNTLLAKPDEICEILQGDGYEIETHPYSPELITVLKEPEGRPLGQHLSHLQGLIYLQEAASALPPYVLNPLPGEKVLDMCAAPGSKSTGLAALMKHEGLLHCNDVSASRRKALVSNLVRCGVTNALVSGMDANKMVEYFPEAYDKVLLDAPCSGEGTLRKDQSALRGWKREDILKMGRRQKGLLEAAIQLTKAGGEILYSTCTLSPEENEYVIEHFLREYPEALEVRKIETLFKRDERSYGILTGEIGEEEARNMLHIWPHLWDTEGFFVVVLKKKISTKNERKTGRKKRSETHAPKAEHPWKKLSTAEKSELIDQYQRSYGVKLSKEREYLRKREEYWMAPEGSQEMIEKIRIERAGLLLGKQDRRGIRMSHEAAVVYGSQMPSNTTREIEGEILERYLKGQTLEGMDWKKTDLPLQVMRVDGKPLGRGMIQPDGSLKNLFPKHLVWR